MALFPWTSSKQEGEFLITRPRFKTKPVNPNTPFPATELYAPAPERASPRDGHGTPMDKAPDPDLGSGRIPARRYTDPAFMTREWDGLWTRSWLLTIRETDIPQPGDTRLYSLGHESILIVRQWDDSIRAFFNVSPHRGNRLVPDDADARASYNVTGFVCPYHNWEWSVDGKLKAVPDPETFRDGLPQGTLDLKPVTCESWAGWVFVNFNSDAEPLSVFLEMLPEHLNCYQWEALVHSMDKTVEWPCNWKTAMDAFSETTHVKAVHPQLLPWTEDYHVQIDTYGRHSRMLVPFFIPSTRHADRATIAPETARQLEALGVHPRNFDNRPEAARRAIQKAKREIQDRLPHLPYRHLNDEQLTDNYNYTIFPNVSVNIFSDYVLLLRVRPHEEDPNRCYCDVQTLVYQDPARPRERAAHSGHGYGEIRFGEVLDQDAAMLEEVQKGLRSRGCEGLYLSDQERRIRHFHAVLMAYLGEPPHVGPPRHTPARDDANAADTDPPSTHTAPAPAAPDPGATPEPAARQQPPARQQAAAPEPNLQTVPEAEAAPAPPPMPGPPPAPEHATLPKLRSDAPLPRSPQTGQETDVPRADQRPGPFMA